MTSQLLRSPLFAPDYQALSTQASAQRSYKRANAIASIHGLSAHDIHTMSQKFWDLHQDPITCIDGAATTLLTIQYNLVVGTLTRINPVGYPDIPKLIKDLLSFKLIGQFCLTELDHGLDAFNLETKATQLPNGKFDLHTPHPGAAKFMPPTVPVLYVPCTAIVFARLFVDEEDLGPAMFLVPLNDGRTMYPGVTAKLLPPRGGSYPVNHALTTFQHVELPSSSLLRIHDTTGQQKCTHSQFMDIIWRVAVGSLCLGSIAIPALQISAFIGIKYGQRRSVESKSSSDRSPLLSISTHQKPVFTALAQAYVLKAFASWAITIFADPSIDHQIRRGIAACAKAVMAQHAQSAHLAISNHCGAQGLFAYNQLCNQHSEYCGISIAEGDLLGLSIKTVADLVRGRYSLPTPYNGDHLVSKHEDAVINEVLELLSAADNPVQTFSRHVLPRCLHIVESIGHRMAYEAAVKSDIPDCLIDMYLCHIIELDMAWYVEVGLVSRASLSQWTEENIVKISNNIQLYTQSLEVDRYVTAPIVSDSSWNSFMEKLPVYTSRL
ncbi:hypothetical protein GYMLUDRAFT_1005358 [Collybiopsis luxurians FD-317 M1]|uniref:Acyl-CoA oxidase C-alpha1 domain-containing protein n=1 Tax=Collybiopsis luxurians FD-317 M1 TaxID=944289 RepID=A0A0D0CKH5_9AGAR|nr:hypothetical protein GYMLUDRAFT_1005358 [Collybiopsis luxurians FD-317 M1]